jgi:ABC-2 type transport system permease protein
MRLIWFRIVQVLGFIRKELVEILRQPKLVATLVFGPFVILLLFGLGYNNKPLELRTVFVGPPDSVYEQVVTDYSGDLEEWVQPEGYTSDQAEAEQRLANDVVDLVVVFPPDPVETVLSGNRAEITVIHDELDPIQQTAIEFATRLAVDEVNSTILARIVGVGQESVQPLDPVRTALRTSASELATAAASQDGATVERVASELGTSAAGASVLLDATHGLLAQFEDQLSTDQLQRLDEARTTLGSIRTMASDVASSAGEARAAGAAQLTSAVDQLDSQLSQLQSVDPAVLVQPFVGKTRVALDEPVGITDFFAPAAIALLVQHLGVTFGALTFVRDRALGLFEVLRVGPVTAIQSLLGKYVAYTMIGAVVAAALAALVVLGLDVPLVGTVGWVAGVLALVLVASLGIGFVASLVAGSDSQAVQFAMIVLLASLFFGGFFLDLERLTYPVEAISLVLPVRYGISALQDVMLRGVAPSTFDLVGLVTLTVVSFGLSWLLLRRRLRVI